MANEPRFEVFPWKRAEPHVPDEYGWRFRAANGQISAIGGEAFTRRPDAHRAVRDLCETLLHDVLLDGEQSTDYAAAPVPILDVDD